MGLYVLRSFPLSSSKTKIFNSTTITPTLCNLLGPPNPKPSFLFRTYFTTLPPKHITNVIPFVGFAGSIGSLYRSKRSFRGGVVVAMAAPRSTQKSEKEWRTMLSPKQFQILRYPGTGEYDKFFEEGIYTCAGCGTPLYRSTTKFNSGCGWPAFYEGLPGAINFNPDPDGMRTEILYVRLVVDTWVMYSKEKVFEHPQMNAIALIVLKFVPPSSNSSH